MKVKAANGLVPILIAAGLKPVTKRIGKIDKARLSTPATIEES